MTKAILDSSFLVALIDEKDKWRNTAVLIQKALKKKKARLLYVDCAVNETIMDIPHIVSFDQDFDEVEGIERIGKP